MSKRKTALGDKERTCEICGLNILAKRRPWISHQRKHVKEGVLFEIPHPTLKSAVHFRNAEYAWWGYVLRSDGQYVTIVSRKAPSISTVIDRHHMEGIPERGAAVRLEFRGARKAGSELDTNHGGWYAEPLGYKQDWIKRTS